MDYFEQLEQELLTNHNLHQRIKDLHNAVAQIEIELNNDSLTIDDLKNYLLEIKNLFDINHSIFNSEEGGKFLVFQSSGGALNKCRINIKNRLKELGEEIVTKPNNKPNATGTTNLKRTYKPKNKDIVPVTNIYYISAGTVALKKEINNKTKEVKTEAQFKFNVDKYNAGVISKNIK